MMTSDEVVAALDVCVAVKLLADAYRSDNAGDYARGRQLRERITRTIPPGRYKDVCAMALSALTVLSYGDPEEVARALELDDELAADLDEMTGDKS